MKMFYGQKWVCESINFQSENIAHPPWVASLFQAIWWVSSLLVVSFTMCEVWATCTEPRLCSTMTTIHRTQNIYDKTQKRDNEQSLQLQTLCEKEKSVFEARVRVRVKVK